MLIPVLLAVPLQSMCQDCDALIVDEVGEPSVKKVSHISLSPNRTMLTACLDFAMIQVAPELACA